MSCKFELVGLDEIVHECNKGVEGKADDVVKVARDGRDQDTGLALDGEATGSVQSLARVDVGLQYRRRILSEPNDSLFRERAGNEAGRADRRVDNRDTGDDLALAEGGQRPPRSNAGRLTLPSLRSASMRMLSSASTGFSRISSSLTTTVSAGEQTQREQSTLPLSPSLATYPR